MKILLIEDDLKLIKYIKKYLTVYDYEVFIVEDFECIVETVDRIEPQLIILDINLPTLDGFYFLKRIRKNHTMPIIILSARSEEGEQIRGMELGADDYITKPFSVGILLAKINAVLRRAMQYSEENKIEDGKLVLLEDSLKLQYEHKTVELSKNEYKIIKLLMQNSGKLVSRDELFDVLTDYNRFVAENTLNVNISRIKSKLKELGLNHVITTKRGLGYVFYPIDN
ncbi:transcriptional regulator [Aneurinibacillus migulanus]|jgi:DNA-binding response OmpR family regulator|uniref:DNA-binding response regulator, OmpR family, contains REC and winged-helix (WHTH) domain n=1 Tax=Aneurinibacillus migulanus TaxID=47500 RepID=A0A0D1YCP0_ANEMI|nr:response regulator transcription factor [Aneurinibacillus migulanus]KIV56822.1 transcriptional regulator [Aneurinibacillus migulanus]KIV60103.1 transcriptional regulator [Aneurinibacillus migulanus]KON96780.1 transcriptional regulator [Aneurinibacillus migulanus]KPD08585.1 transcriptional regulator [Aneurinibacillus migulanus]MCP1358228.1 response regulator transcription factor [Aneurinibacillus migulanus]